MHPLADPEPELVTLPADVAEAPDGLLTSDGLADSFECLGKHCCFVFLVVLTVEVALSEWI